MTTDFNEWRPEQPTIRRPLRDLTAYVGEEVVHTRWRRIDQAHVDQFHWSIDCVPERADTWVNSSFPRGAQNIDGFMLLSHLQSAFFNCFPFYDECGVMYIYGVDQLRFPATAYVEHELRVRATIVDVTEKARGLLCRSAAVIDLKGVDRPALSAHFLLFYTSPGI